MTHKEASAIENSLKVNFNFSWVARNLLNGILYLIQDRQVTPFQILNIFGKKRSKKAILGYYNSPRMSLSRKESDLVGNFYYDLTKMKVSSDKALGNFLNFGRYSPEPLIGQLSDLHKSGNLPPTTIWYGDFDWMDTYHSYEQLRKYGLENNIRFQIIQNAGHQVVFNNPMEVAKQITLDFKYPWNPVAPVDYVNKETFEIQFYG